MKRYALDRAILVVLLLVSVVLLIITNKDEIKNKLSGYSENILETVSSGNEETTPKEELSPSLNADEALTSSEIADDLNTGKVIPGTSGQQEKMQLVDSRIPDPFLVATFVNKPVEVEFRWDNYNGMAQIVDILNVDEDMYNYYKSLTRYYAPEEYIKYMDDPVSLLYFKQIAEDIKNMSADMNYSEYETVREIINFVQNIEYVYDGDDDFGEWPKYPIETIFDKGGDCEDTSILLAGILRELGYGLAFIQFDDHVALGILGDDKMTGTYYNYEGNNYFYIETTNVGWGIGDIPEEYDGREAIIIPIK